MKKYSSGYIQINAPEIFQVAKIALRASPPAHLCLLPVFRNTGRGWRNDPPRPSAAGQLGRHHARLALIPKEN